MKVWVVLQNYEDTEGGEHASIINIYGSKKKAEQFINTPYMKGKDRLVIEEWNVH